MEASGWSHFTLQHNKKNKKPCDLRCPTLRVWVLTQWGQCEISWGDTETASTEEPWRVLRGSCLTQSAIDFCKASCMFVSVMLLNNWEDVVTLDGESDPNLEHRQRPAACDTACWVTSGQLASFSALSWQPTFSFKSLPELYKCQQTVCVISRMILPRTK